MTFPLVIVTPKKKYFEGPVDLLNLVTAKGQIGILARHQPLVTIVTIGPIHIKVGSKTSYFAVSNGVLSVQKDRTVLLVDAIERPGEIDLARAKAAKERALKRLELKAQELDVARAKAALARALNRIEIYEKHQDE